jgi:hypothetical protein
VAIGLGLYRNESDNPVSACLCIDTAHFPVSSFLSSL